MDLVHRGKVRDIWSDRPGELILVASDRVSVYDVVLPTPVPDRGKLLTSLSLWWFDQLGDLVPNHLISADDVPAEWAGRAMRCQQLDIVPVECIARGYLAGQGFEAYQREGEIHGVALPEGLVEGDRLPEPIFTPTTKTPPEEGHDEPLTFAEVVGQIGSELAEKLRELTLEIYRRAAATVEARGVVLADTKFEFGLTSDGEVVLADEVLTPDSSRYWRAEDWQPGGAQQAYDKQYVRDWSRGLEWDRTPPGPEIPDEVVAETRRRYIVMYERITGETPFGMATGAELDDIRVQQAQEAQGLHARLRDEPSGRGASEGDRAGAERHSASTEAEGGDRAWAPDDR